MATNPDGSGGMELPKSLLLNLVSSFSELLKDIPLQIANCH